jgi:hypothetical protein
MIAALSAALLLAGCQEPPPPQPDRPPPNTPPPVAQTPPPPPAAPAKDRFPLDQQQFKAGAMGKTRDEVHAQYGPPDELGEWGPSVGWDGPVSIYHGPFTIAGSEENAAATKANARVYFGKSGGKTVAASVEFTDQ